MFNTISSFPLLCRLLVISCIFNAIYYFSVCWLSTLILILYRQKFCFPKTLLIFHLAITSSFSFFIPVMFLLCFPPRRLSFLKANILSDEHSMSILCLMKAIICFKVSECAGKKRKKFLCILYYH